MNGIIGMRLSPDSLHSVVSLIVLILAGYKTVTGLEQIQDEWM
jgi:hypothetical protein